MTAASLATFNAARVTAQNALFGRPVRIAGLQVRGAYSAPRLDYTLAESTVGRAKYTTVLRIPATEVRAITTVAEWLTTTVELLEDGTWRSYEVLPDVQFVQESEWRVGLRSR